MSNGEGGDMAGNDPEDRSGDADRINYLMGDDLDAPLHPDDQAELDAFLALVDDPSLWDEPGPHLGDRIVSAITDEAREAGLLRPVSALPPPPAATAGRTSSASDTPANVVPLASRRRNRILDGIGAALIGAAAATLIAVVVTRDDNSTPSVAEPDATITIVGTDLEPSVSGAADITVVQSGVRIELNVPGLPRRDGDEFYEAWLRSVDGEGLVPIGTFHDANGVVLWAGVTIDDYPILTVTRETVAGPKDPNQGSSGEVVVKGQLGG
jgi:hypothetical protein